MQYITGQTINATTVAFKTERGANVEITLVRNAKLAANGWLDSTTHTIQLVVNGSVENYCGAEEDATLGYVIKARMGKATLPIPAAYVEQVKALVAECNAHNDAERREAAVAEAAYENQVAAIERMRAM